MKVFFFLKNRLQILPIIILYKKKLYSFFKYYNLLLFKIIIANLFLSIILFYNNCLFIK